MDKEKLEKWKGRVQDFTNEMLEDVMPEELRTTAETAVRDVFKQNSIPYRKSEVKAFAEGVLFMFEASQKSDDKTFQMAIPMLVKGMAQKLERKVASQVDEAIKHTTGNEEKPV